MVDKKAKDDLKKSVKQQSPPVKEDSKDTLFPVNSEQTDRVLTAEGWKRKMMSFLKRPRPTKKS